PARLIGLAVMVAVDVAIDLDAVFVIAPLIHAVVAVGVHEVAQDLVFGVAHNPTGLAAGFLGLNRALGRFLGAGMIVLNVFLNRLNAQSLGYRGSTGRESRSRRQQRPNDSNQ